MPHNSQKSKVRPLSVDTDPKCFDDMIFSNKVSEQLIGNILNHVVPFPKSGRRGLLLYGSPGTGKSTYAKLFCDEFERTFDPTSESAWSEWINCDSSDEPYKAIKKTLGTASTFGGIANKSGYFYIILDEVDKLSDKAKQVVKQLLDTPNVVCVLSTNYIAKLDPAFQSRCFKVEFNPAQYKDYLPRLRSIIQQNGLPSISDKRLLQLVQNAGGDWRDLGPMLVAECNLVLQSSQQPSARPALKVVK